MINKTETGKRISALRGKLGYSQAAFAEKLNVSPQAVSKWETGAALPDVDILLILSWICRVTINEILDSEEIFVNQTNSIEREILRINKILICPECKEDLSLKIQAKTGNQATQYFECKNSHKFSLEDGVIFFKTREIKGELWSLYLRNYEHYFREVTSPPLPRYLEHESEFSCPETIWREVEKIKPSTILDIASGNGGGIKYLLRRINWPCTVILTDLSFRILAWNRRFFSEEIGNPYVDLVFLACDCSKIPLRDNSIDMVLSDGGFESMQDKKMQGFSETYRILKTDGHAVYNMSLVDDHDSENTKKWAELTLPLRQTYSLTESLKDYSEWLSECRKAGFSQNDSIKIHGEMPAPESDVFPFENQISRWMARHVFISKK